MLKIALHRRLKILSLFYHLISVRGVPLNFPAGGSSGTRKIKRIQIPLITTRITFSEDVSTIPFFCCFISLRIAAGKSPPAFLESGKHLISAVLQKPMSLKLCKQLQDRATTTNTTVSSSTHCTQSGLPPGKKELFLPFRSFLFLPLLPKPTEMANKYIGTAQVLTQPHDIFLQASYIRSIRSI